MAILSAHSGSSDQQSDNRRVALLKSLTTNNRFYVLVDPASGLKNADTIEKFPEDAILGIAYPCLEDGLNDFAIIRSTFETLDQFPEDEGLHTELMDIIRDAQQKLTRRLQELHDRVARGQAHFLGADLEEFKDYTINVATKGVPRRTLDSMMKLDVFESVATTEALLNGTFDPEFVYVYEFLPKNPLDEIREMQPCDFVCRIFDDILGAVENLANYKDRHTFDRNVFQKFIALMFVNYATTEPVFYGTNKADYGVSIDKDMDATPLYLAVGKVLRELEKEHLICEHPARAAREMPEPGVLPGSRTLEFSSLPIADQQVIGHLIPICEAARILLHLEPPRARECAEMILRAAHRLFMDLRQLGVITPAANSPIDPEFQDHK